MKILEANNGAKQEHRTVYCHHCASKLGVTDADLKLVNDHHEALCLVCHKWFHCMTEAELTQAYYAK